MEYINLQKNKSSTSFQKLSFFFKTLENKFFAAALNCFSNMHCLIVVVVVVVVVVIVVVVVVVVAVVVVVVVVVE